MSAGPSAPYPISSSHQAWSAPESVMVAAGVSAVVLGGVVAALTGPLGLARGSWIAAYLVLVLGVVQVAMGHSRIQRPTTRVRARWGWAQWGCWNTGGTAVIAGTVVARSWAVDVGSVLLLVALALALDAARADPRPAAGTDSRLWVVGYRVLLLVLAVSVPIGVILSHARHP